ncbi:MAG: Uma2 family endonuclease [Streptosporangiaceae bacterium]|nr:Uma2 family endonuclease [Streptosporangiaceae bacterium]
MKEKAISGAAELEAVADEVERGGGPIALVRPGHPPVVVVSAEEWQRLGNAGGAEDRPGLAGDDFPRPGPYTVDDLDDLARFPPEDGAYEMRDGWVILSGWHSLSDEVVIDNVKALLRSAAGRADANVQVLTPRIATPDGVRNSRIPDVAVVDAAALAADMGAGRRYLTGGVLIVAEVASPDRATEDHTAKVADYARAGIEWYWLIDTSPELTVTVLRLAGAGYVEHDAARAGETLTLSEPFPVAVDVAALRDH